MICLVLLYVMYVAVKWSFLGFLALMGALLGLFIFAGYIGFAVLTIPFRLVGGAARG